MADTDSTSPLTAARRSRGLTQESVAARWSMRWPDQPKTAKAVSYWETGARTPSVEVLRRLSTIYGCTMSELLGEAPPQRATSALAVVTWGQRVLLVFNRQHQLWQLPAGAVHDDRDPRSVAVRECRAETGIHTVARQVLGERLHPRTRVWCIYVACEYIDGEAFNGDPDENELVQWVPLARLEDFIPLATLFEPVANHLGVSRCLQSA